MNFRSHWGTTAPKKKKSAFSISSEKLAGIPWRDGVIALTCHLPMTLFPFCEMVDSGKQNDGGCPWPLVGSLETATLTCGAPLCPGRMGQHPAGCGPCLALRPSRRRTATMGLPPSGRSTYSRHITQIANLGNEVGIVEILKVSPDGLCGLRPRRRHIRCPVEELTAHWPCGHAARKLQWVWRRGVFGSQEGGCGTIDRLDPANPR